MKKDHHPPTAVAVGKKIIRAISITNLAVLKALTIVIIMKKRKKNPAIS